MPGAGQPGIPKNPVIVRGNIAFLFTFKPDPIFIFEIIFDHATGLIQLSALKAFAPEAERVTDSIIEIIRSIRNVRAQYRVEPTRWIEAIVGLVDKNYRYFQTSMSAYVRACASGEPQRSTPLEEDACVGPHWKCCGSVSWLLDGPSTGTLKLTKFTE